MMVDGADYNLISTIFFHPYYSISDWIKYFQRDMGVYLDFLFSDEINAFSLKGRLDYEVPTLTSTATGIIKPISSLPRRILTRSARRISRCL